ncbi:glycine betaine ABC transporter substrate-binding protein [Natranaerobius thermophilus]|uniref:Substrate-binding region of ABC-type glycine betaine transport system n=1 Tax=Natranaerobius thermophilus (strain ATCC BAA-1301 / DSM 18059 / JW/NM-WN-LF) TaxID=457570 RepID=B2A4K7_NATTJ|nr:glycine betaine ABC transporter substrate-binding protein [Natranaerobius thermophilus]ACB85182.1 Substrate-binding region of ABC-type glycine betaine transport system [Natranaerobius thermophilus JW/NM-WN-LF]
MKTKLGFMLVAVMIIGLLVIVACSEGEAEEVQEVKIPYVDWACASAKTHLVAGILEEMGYEVELTMADPGVVYTDLARGNQDFYVAAWLPVTHGSYYEEHGENLSDLGAIFEGARIGLVVPDYVDIDSIDELKEYIAEFDGEIIGIDSGAGIMEATENAQEAYESLEDYSLITSSDSGMTAELRRSIQNEDWVVVTGWTPHWKFAEWDLKFLDDPEGIYGEAEDIRVMARTDLEEDMPEVVELLENMFLTDEELGELMGMISESGDEAGSVKEWMEKYEDQVSQWIP